MADMQISMLKYHIYEIDKCVRIIAERYNFMWERIRPKEGELWEKKPCGKGKCSVGWSVGVGVHRIKGNDYSWGTIDQIMCGCLVKVEE